MIPPEDEIVPFCSQFCSNLSEKGKTKLNLIIQLSLTLIERFSLVSGHGFFTWNCRQNHKTVDVTKKPHHKASGDMVRIIFYFIIIMKFFNKFFKIISKTEFNFQFQKKSSKVTCDQCRNKENDVKCQHRHPNI